MPANIYELIHRYEREFQTLPVKVVPGYDFNQSETLKRINLYQNGQFLDGNKDSLGDKIFFDITTPTVRNAAKNIDLDTKDIQFRAINGKANYFQAWLYRRKAKEWMRNNKIAQKLNKIPEKVSGYGTVVLKKTGGPGVFEFVDLRNLACDASAKCLNDGWASERHYYTPNELRKLQEDLGWDKEAVDKAIDDFIVHRQENFVGEQKTADKRAGNAQYICVHEFYGYIEKNLITDNPDDTDLVLSNFIVILPEDSNESKETSTAANNSKKNGLVLYKSEIEEMPYKELHYRRVDGRWLGRGLWEESFPMQETKNTLSNWQLMAMRLSQLIVFQTRDKTVLQNVLTDVQNGSIMKFGSTDVPSPMLERVDTQAKDNASTNLLDQNVRQVMQNLTNSFEVTTGESLPSGTPFQLGALMNQNANKLFEFIREDYGLFLEDVFNSWVLPELEKELTKKSIMEIVDKDDLEYIREHFAKWKVWDSIKKSLISGMKPTTNQVEILQTFVEQQLAKQDSIFLDIEEGFLSYKKRVEVTVTDESESPVMLQTLTTIMQTVSQNPQLIDSPVFQRILDIVGLSVADLTPIAAPPQVPNPAQAMIAGAQ